ncbi:28S ribosomal protein S24, mitochondrial isoform X1 [Nasonia vitripennis]|uniref:28S ribosomal protein S24, mitochondrial n=2 Tax=Nasonia vitripennis TaxID=7425 RepID=A0A7M7G1S2_NASVI|nr:28S ribosomal protein S24, mitochondrial isoform X1 [Nasonia vitripennis]
MALLMNISNILLPKVGKSAIQRCIHISAALNKVQSGRYRVTLKKNRPLTYEMAYKPSDIAHKKSWNSWNTSNIVDGNRPMESAVEDMFIRRFMTGTWHGLFVSEIIVKRHHNMVRVAGIIQRNLDQRKIYFLTGYSEELMSYYLHCPVKIELQSVEKKEEVIYKYI